MPPVAYNMVEVYVDTATRAFQEHADAGEVEQVLVKAPHRQRADALRDITSSTSS